MASSTMSIPFLRVAPKKARKAPPIPPAAPAPATGTISIAYFSVITLAKDAMPSSKRFTISASAPF